MIINTIYDLCLQPISSMVLTGTVTVNDHHRNILTEREPNFLKVLRTEPLSSKNSNRTRTQNFVFFPSLVLSCRLNDPVSVGGVDLS